MSLADTRYIRAHVVLGPDAAAMFLAWVAYPELGKQEDRLKFVKAVSVAAYKSTGRHPPIILKGIKADRAVASINKGLKRIQSRRIRAAWLAAKRLDGVPLRAACSEMVEREIIPVTETQYSNDEPHQYPNIRRQIWEESLPALAMTMALPLGLAGDSPRLLTELLYDPSWVAQAMDDSQKLAPWVGGIFEPQRILVPEV